MNIWSTLTGAIIFFLWIYQTEQNSPISDQDNEYIRKAVNNAAGRDIIPAETVFQVSFSPGI